MNLGVWRMKDFMQSMCNVFVEVYAYIYIYMGAFHGIISYPLLLRGPRKARAPIYIHVVTICSKTPSQLLWDLGECLLKILAVTGILHDHMFWTFGG